MGSVLSVEHLQKSYGHFVAVSDVSFEVEEGEIFGILGPNGAGKTTTVESLQGLRSIEGGEVSVLGFDPRAHATEIRKRIGSQLQESALPDRIKVWEALDLFGSLSEEGPSWEDLLVDWGLAEKKDARFGSLSGGQQQRLFVALALVNDPQIVFLDEMTTGLDPSSRRIAWDLIRQIRERGTTVVLVTHFMDEAENLCDRLIVIDEGRVAAEARHRTSSTATGAGCGFDSPPTRTSAGCRMFNTCTGSNGIATATRCGAMGRCSSTWQLPSWREDTNRPTCGQSGRPSKTSFWS